MARKAKPEIGVKPCRKCGGTRRGKPRKGNTLGECLDCVAAKTVRWRAENPEQSRSQSARYRAEHPEKARELDARNAARRRAAAYAADPLAVDDPASKENPE